MNDAALRRPVNLLISTDSKLTEREFLTLSTLVQELTGISIPKTKRMLLQSRLARRLRVLNMDDFSEYCQFVRQDTEAARNERQELISAVTTNVTRFFREPHHFGDLKARVLPPLLQRARNGEQIRLWSSACSSGEEPYSLAFTILDLMPEAYRLDIKILATDLDREILRTALRGEYPVTVLDDIHKHSRPAHLAPRQSVARNVVEIGDIARSLVSFKQLNLATTWPFRGAFDVILCRNVLIYFARATEAGVFSQFSKFLKRGGFLYLGHSERLDTAAFPQFKNDGVTTYRRI